MARFDLELHKRQVRLPRQQPMQLKHRLSGELCPQQVVRIELQQAGVSPQMLAQQLQVTRPILAAQTLGYSAVDQVFELVVFAKPLLKAEPTTELNKLLEVLGATIGNALPELLIEMITELLEQTPSLCVPCRGAKSPWQLRLGNLTILADI